MIIIDVDGHVMAKIESISILLILAHKHIEHFLTILIISIRVATLLVDCIRVDIIKVVIKGGCDIIRERIMVFGSWLIVIMAQIIAKDADCKGKAGNLIKLVTWVLIMLAISYEMKLVCLISYLNLPFYLDPNLI
jgi:hypothetical protein